MIDFSFDERFRVTKGKSFSLSDHDPSYTAGIHNEEEARRDLEQEREKMFDLQEKLYASGRNGMLIIFQAMDAAGKDSTIKHVLSGLNQQGCSVTRFRRPSKVDIAHDFLWRAMHFVPERGEIAIFNRSYYEDVLICKVRPEFILEQKLPGIFEEDDIKKKFWERRYESIRHVEEHLSNNGTTIVKFFLHVSKKEQRKRLLERIDDPTKHWKFDVNDLRERELWSEYKEAYEDAIANTATDYAPWHVIPADNKWFMQMVVADIIRGALESLHPAYPEPDQKMEEALKVARTHLAKE